LVVGLVAGLAIGGLVPHTPLHAVATDHVENCAIATGFVDEEVEAIYFLDFLTGTLKAAVLSQRDQAFQARFEANIAVDLAGVITRLNMATAGGRRGATPAAAIQMPAQPRYLMVTGLNDVRTGRQRFGLGAVYVAEVNTGILLCYLVPWALEAHSANQPVVAPLVLWTADRFSSAIIRQ
jgi:hypothetical protein